MPILLKKGGQLIVPVTKVKLTKDGGTSSEEDVERLIPSLGRFISRHEKYNMETLPREARYNLLRRESMAAGIETMNPVILCATRSR